MKIWAFPSFYPFDYPGKKWQGIFAHRQFKGLIQNGADLNVIVPVLWSPPAPFHKLDPNWQKQHEINYPLKRVYDGVTVYHPRISNMRPSRFFKKTYEERYIDAINSLFIDQNIKLERDKDIFYSQWLPDSVMVQKAAHRAGIKSAVLAIGDDVIVWPHENEKALNAFKKVWSEADMRFSVAGYLAKEGNIILGKEAPYVVVRRGVEYDFFKPVAASEKGTLRKKFNIPENKIVILSIGTAIKRKGWLDLFDALQHIRAANSEFVLVGAHAGSPDFDMAAEVKKRGLDDIFLNLGEVDPKMINALYNSADIFCLPSHWEGIANAVVEAMSSGLPVITTNVCGHPELITNGVNGILIDPKQPAILAEKIQELLANEGMRKMLSENARSFIVNTWGNFADNAKLLYQKLQG